MSKPKVIFVNRVYHPSEAATAQLLHDLAGSLAAAGWPVEVIAAGDETTAETAVRVHRTGGTPAHGGLISRARNYLAFLRRARARLAVTAKPGDIVVPMTDPPMLGAAVTTVARTCGARVVHWVQDIYPEIVTAHTGAWLTVPMAPLRAWRNKAWRAAAACVVVGEEMGTTAVAQGVPTGRVHVIENWAPRELAEPVSSADVASIRREWNLEGRLAVAYSGNLGRVHEFEAVLAAAVELREETRIGFAFVGSGARFDEVRRSAIAQNLGNVRFLPAQPRARLAASLAAADAHLVTLRPGFERLVNPSKLAGVLAAARPVLFVGPPHGAIARLLAAEDCGQAFAPDNGPGLAAAIRQLRADPARAAAFGANARRAYERRFTLAAAAAAWEEVLGRVAASPP